MVSVRLPTTGRYSPLRYPGGKGKLAGFIKNVVRLNGLSDGCYVEPYAGGAAVAWELLITGVVRRVYINDINRPVFAFWDSVVNQTDLICRRIMETPLTVEEWFRQKKIFQNAENEGDDDVAFAFFFLNRTNRSGVLNGGIIGGRSQKGRWKIDARFNRCELIKRIQKIALFRSRINISNMDAMIFLQENVEKFPTKTFVYIDPPYYQKGRYLYYDAYDPDDHQSVANFIRCLERVKWMVSYDDVQAIRDLYKNSPCLQYELWYSARNSGRGREVIFFSKELGVPDMIPPLLEISRNIKI